MRNAVVILILLTAFGAPARGADPAAPRVPVYLWLEPEWFPDVHGYTEYHSGPERLAQVQGHWGLAGPGISAEWTQGGESEWNSMAAGPNETNAVASRDIQIPRAGRYKVWVRYYDHREKSEPFTVRIEQAGKAALEGELGVEPVVPPNDEYALYWGFSFGWGAVQGDLKPGAATLKLVANKKCDTWRQLDAVLITDDADFAPVGREKPRFAYFDAFDLAPRDAVRGGAKPRVGESWKRSSVANRDFSMWSTSLMWSDWAWLNAQPKPGSLSDYDVHFQTAAFEDVREAFHKQFAGRKDVPVVSWPHLIPGMSINTPDLRPGSNLRQWLEATDTPFFLLSSNAAALWDAEKGAAAWEALNNGKLSERFLGFICGESLGTEGVRFPADKLAPTRRGHVDALGKHIFKQQAAEWSKMFKREIPDGFTARNISCLSVESVPMAHLWHEMGAKIVGWETDGTNVHTPMRIAFARGAARQYNAAWINYASGNFGDACNYFAQDPIVPRGAKGWYHSKYAVTDGVPISWYRNLYYLNYLSGASAIFWEQSLRNQFIKPGPGDHPVQLSPFGRATVDFQNFVDRLPDRGEPYTPVAVLLSYGHGYEPVHYSCRMLHAFERNRYDDELRELFNVMWFPIPVDEGKPATPLVQNFASGTYGNIFDVLVDRPSRADALRNYPVVVAAGDVELGGEMAGLLRDYVQKGGTLVVNAVAAKGKLPADLLGLRLKDDRNRYESWKPADTDRWLPCPPFQVERVELQGAKPLAVATGDEPIITRHSVGEGAVIVTLVPQMLTSDERAHPSLPFLMNGLTRGLLPIEITLADGRPPRGGVMYQVNRTKNGWLVALFNNRGVDKTQHGVAKVDRRAFVDLVVCATLPVASAKEWTQPRDLVVKAAGERSDVVVRVHPGDVQVVELRLSK